MREIPALMRSAEAARVRVSMRALKLRMVLGAARPCVDAPVRQPRQLIGGPTRRRFRAALARALGLRPC